MESQKLIYKSCLWLIVLALLAGCMPIQAAPIQHADVQVDDQMAALPEELGTVNFPVSCTAEAQAEFNHGVAFLHSFWFAPAIEAFNRAAALDPTCAMAHWGVAMSLRSIPWQPTPEPALAAGWEAVKQAMAAGAPTPREQAYIDAVAAFYRDPETRDHRTHTLAHEAAMEQLAQDYPDDTEAQIFYALALNITSQPTDKTYANN